MGLSDNKSAVIRERTFLHFVDSLPESEESVLVEFLNAVRQASSLAEVNVAAGIAYARLTGETWTMFTAVRGEWDYEWLADERRGRVYEDGRGQIGEFNNEEDAKLAVCAVNAIRSLGRTP